MPKEFGQTYDGTIYRAVGNWLGERYFDYGFTKGTAQEVDFLVDLLELCRGARVLDVGCGPGRHSVELARRGYYPIGVDISDRFVEIANRMMADEGLGGEFHVLDARLMDFQSTADVAICLCEGAFGLAGSDAAHRQVLDNVYRALRPGGRLVLSAINTPHVVQHLAGDDRFDANTGTIRDDEVIVGSDGLERQVTIYTTTFSFRELRLLLERSGFEVMAGYGCNVGHFERKPLTVDDVEIMMVARKA